MSVKKVLMERGMKLMSDPRVMKIMSNPKVMNTVMKGFQVRGQVQASVDEKLKTLAKTFHFATRDEVRDLKDTVRNLERTIKDLQADVKSGNGTGKH